MKTSLKKTALILFFFTLITGCTESDTSDTSPTSSVCEEQLLSLTNILLTKTNALNSNPTKANCQAFKTAWYNVYMKLKECGHNSAEIEQAKNSYDSIDCNVF